MRLGPGDHAPFFDRLDETARRVTLDDYAGQGLIIFFYPRAFTPGCTTEACDFRDRHDALYAAGYELIGVSPDPVEKLRDFRSKHALPYPLLSDPDHAMAAAYGAWGMKKNYGREYEGVIRSTIAVDAGGVVEHAWYNVRAKGHAQRIGEALSPQ